MSFAYISLNTSVFCITLCFYQCTRSIYRERSLSNLTSLYNIFFSISLNFLCRHFPSRFTSISFSRIRYNGHIYSSFSVFEEMRQKEQAYSYLTLAANKKPPRNSRPSTQGQLWLHYYSYLINCLVIG